MRAVASASKEKAMHITGALGVGFHCSSADKGSSGELLKFDLGLFIRNKPSFPFSKYSCVSNGKALCSIIKGSL